VLSACRRPATLRAQGNTALKQSFASCCVAFCCYACCCANCSFVTGAMNAGTNGIPPTLPQEALRRTHTKLLEVPHMAGPDVKEVMVNVLGAVLGPAVQKGSPDDVACYVAQHAGTVCFSPGSACATP